MTASTSLCEAFQRTAAMHPDAVALRAYGTDQITTWGQYAEHVRDIAAKLAGLGVRRGDTVGFMLTNRPEFHLWDAAAMHLGATCYSIYNTSAPEQIAYIVGHAGSQVLITESQFTDTLRAAVPGVEHVLNVEDDDIELLESDPSFDFDAAWQAVQPEDVLTLIYTSGTTGPPKGVELTHVNVAFNAAAITQLGGLQRGERLISYLPAAHVADRCFSHYFAMTNGFEITCLADMAAIAPALADTRPTFFPAVPRVWEKLKLAVEMQLAGNEAMSKAFEAGDQNIRAAIRAKLGLDELRWALSGASPLAPDVHQFLIDLGLPVTELWGMSECGLGTTCPPDDIRTGTVGRFAPGLEGRLADDGELLVRGPGVMQGYRNDPEKTAEAIDTDGWLHTGDIATIDDDGYVRIIDRKKELIINAAGKNMSPANIQNAIVSGSPLIGAAMVVGDNRPYNVALVVLDPEAGAAFGAQHGLDTDPAVLAKDERVQAAVQAGVDAGNATLSRVEQVKRFAILPTFWAPGGDEITPTMKLRRRNIADKYATDIDLLYQ